MCFIYPKDGKSLLQPSLRSLNHHVVNLLSPLYFTQMDLFPIETLYHKFVLAGMKYVLCQTHKSGVETVGRLKRSFKINVTFSNPKQLPFNTWAKPGDRLLVMSLFMLCLNDVWKSDRGSLPPSLRAPTTNCFYFLKWKIIHTCRPVRLNAVFKVAVQKHTSTDYRLWLFHKLLWDQIRPNMKNSLVQSNKHHKTNYGRRFVPLNIEKREETNENEKLTKENLTNHHQHCGKDLCLIQKL